MKFNTKQLLISILCFLGGVSNNLPELFYFYGIGPFEIFTLILTVTYSNLIIIGELKLSSLTVKKPVVYIFLLFLTSYVAFFFGFFQFGMPDFRDVIEPFRYLQYILLISLVSKLITQRNDLVIALFGLLVGSFYVIIQSYFLSEDKVFIGGLPVLYNPNVVANIIGYCFLLIFILKRFNGISFVSSLILFVWLTFFMFITFSKAGWIILLLSWVAFIIIFEIKSIPIVFFVILCHYLFSQYEVYSILNDALDTKLNASISTTTQVGSFEARLGFLYSSVKSLLLFPFGIGSTHFYQIHLQNAKILGPDIYEFSTSTHSAIGYLMISNGFFGLLSFAYLLVSVIPIFYRKYSSFWSKNSIFLYIVFVILLLSSLFQIELISQPFFYLLISFRLSTYYCCNKFSN